MAVTLGLLLLVLAFGANGYALASAAHFQKSPNQRLVERLGGGVRRVFGEQILRHMEDMRRLSAGP